MVSESTIFWLQVFAAAFMAADYFLTEDQRKCVNRFIFKALTPMVYSANKDIRQKIKAAEDKKITIAIAAIGLLISLLWSEHIAPRFHIEALNLLSIPFAAIGGAGLVILTTVGVNYLAPALVSSFMNLIAKFLLRCPKGSVFGIGFIFLRPLLLVAGQICHSRRQFMRPQAKPEPTRPMCAAA